jgi:putative chitinase
VPFAIPALLPALAAVAPLLPPAGRDAWVQVLTPVLSRTDIGTPRRVAAFLGQCAAESGGFRILEENLNYSAARLCQVWPNRFPSLAAAAPFAFQPTALADSVYAGRMGNGNRASGDGWRFRGRGLIQLTGRSTYQRFAASCEQSLDSVVAAATTRQGAAEGAAWFWTENGLNGLADNWALDLITRRINGGLQGAADRARLCEAALEAIGA